ncbi:MAG: DUF4249 domain-containing protein [Paludibacteraceae bacterium]
MKKIIYTLLTGFMLLSCEKTIDFKEEITDPLLVVSSFITPDSTIKAHVSLSKFFLYDDDNYYNSFKSVDNAEFSFSVNGIEKGKLIALGNGYYQSNYKPAVGEQIKIDVKSNGYTTVFSTAEIPGKPSIIQVDTTTSIEKYYDYYTVYDQENNLTYDTVGETTRKKIYFKIKFKDNGEQKDYYRFVVLKRSYSTKQPTYGGGTIDVEEYLLNEVYLTHFDDIIFGNQTNNTNGWFDDSSSSEYSFDTFSDDFINGKEYNLTFSDYLNRDYTGYDDAYGYSFIDVTRAEYHIYLQSISSDYYLYSKSYAAANSVEDNPFTEPVQIHSNIKNGIGIFGSYTSSDVWMIKVKN